MKWNTKISIQDKFDKERLFEVNPFLYNATLSPVKQMCRIEASELNKKDEVIKSFYLYADLTHSVVDASTNNAMPADFILGEMDRLVKTGKEHW